MFLLARLQHSLWVWGLRCSHPLQRDSLQAFREKDWKFEQASRLELLRHEERDIRQHLVQQAV